MLRAAVQIRREVWTIIQEELPRYGKNVLARKK